MSSIAIIDYGMGNLHSIAKALQHVAKDTDILVTADPHTIDQADRVVFPGVGAIRDCIGELTRLDLIPVIQRAAADKPFLGICLGVQALMDYSEENEGTQCLGLIPGQVRYFGDDPLDPRTGERLKVPHMGWNQVNQTVAHALWQKIPEQSYFYFVHSYFVEPQDDHFTAGTSEYGRFFTCAVAHGNIFAVQFHPEKSHYVGLQLLANFVIWNGEE